MHVSLSGPTIYFQKLFRAQSASKSLEERVQSASAHFRVKPQHKQCVTHALQQLCVCEEKQQD